jgi:hypothetical protein
MASREEIGFKRIEYNKDAVGSQCSSSGTGERSGGREDFRENDGSLARVCGIRSIKAHVKAMADITLGLVQSAGDFLFIFLSGSANVLRCFAVLSDALLDVKAQIVKKKLFFYHLCATR